MGKLSKMQGTSAFIEVIRDDNSLKGHSCRACDYYYDGICKLKNVAFEYGDNYARNCLSYTLKGKKLNISKNENKSNTKNKKINRSANEAGMKKSSSTNYIKTSENYRKNNSLGAVKQEEVRVKFGDIVTIRDLKSNKIYKAQIETNSRSLSTALLTKALFDKKVSDKIVFRDVVYEVLKIKRS